MQVMHRIHWPSLSALASGVDSIVIDGPEAHHAARVKRLRPGEGVELLDGHGLVGYGKVVEVEPRQLTVRLERLDKQPLPSRRLEIASPIPKGAKPEQLIDQLSQIGVDHWQPIITERSEVHPRASRQSKWRETTIVESAKQCGRAFFMEIGKPIQFADWLRERRGVGTSIFLADSSGAGGWELEPGHGSLVCFAIGPEGGWSDSEREMAQAAGIEAVSLGPFVLRTETACVAAAARAMGWRGL